MRKEHEILFNQLRDYRNDILGCVADLSEEASNTVPTGFNNNILWNLGHIYLDQLLWIKHLTKEPIGIPEGFNEWFGFGTSPANWASQPPSLEELKQLLARQPEWIKETYGDRLDETFPETESGMQTIAQVLVRTIYHEGIHLGAIIALRKFI
ncbi:DinB family protein [Neobacillus sp. YIM B06451]|uniref:DinB family protein n=1 Tax=Neobacillus sp. YIM B06451 TaxID=3070994 RepID=UPI00292FF686|nr:DinB family protein [Neobacillus sp. YIM B06451]